MKKIFYHFILLFIATSFGLIGSFPTYAQSWKTPTEVANSNYIVQSISDGYFTSNTEGWMTTYGGAILHTSDGGATWRNQTTGITTDLFGVHFVSSTQGWAVGASGTILTTNNGGTTWTAQTSGSTRDLYGVYFTSSTQGWAVGGSGTILTTSNGGATWTTQTSGITNGLRKVVFVSATKGWAVGNSGRIITTNDGGSTWSAQASGITQQLNGVSFTSATNGCVVGNEGKILTTTNGGSTWTSQNSGSGVNLYGVHLSSTTDGWATGDYNTILKTTNGGVTWTEQLTEYNFHNFVKAFFTSPTKGWAFSTSGRVLTTNDGSTWTQLASSCTSYFWEIFFINDSVGWAVGSQGVIYKSTDGGINWTEKTSGTTESLFSVHFINETRGWAVGDDGIILTTSDGGDTWTTQTSGTTINFKSVYFIDALKGWAVGYSGNIYRTTNGGATWTSQSAGGNVSTIYKIGFVDALNGWATANSGNMIITNDGGNTWVIHNVGLDVHLNGGHFVSATHGWAGGNYFSNGVVFKTTDGGNTWSSGYTGYTQGVSKVHFVDNNVGWALCGQGVLLNTTNGGTNWASQPINVFSANNIFFRSSTKGWVVGQDGFLKLYTNDTATTTTTLTSNNNPASVGGNIHFTATVTPNTATGTVIFKDGTTTLGTATLSSGVATLNTDLLTVGTHTITAEYSGDASNAASTSGAISQVVNALTAPNLSFIRQIADKDNSTISTSYAFANATDASGNVYVTGHFEGTVSLGNIKLVSAGAEDVFIAKYNASGVLQWAKRAGGSGDDSGWDIEISGSDMYVIGRFTNTANFNTPSASGSNEITSAGDSDIFLAKYTTSGEIQWIRRAGGTGLDEARGIGILGTDIYITGIFEGTANFNNPSATGSNEITSAGDYDIFLAKYNSSGNIQWIKRAGGSGYDSGMGLAVSSTDIYITGNFTGTANFNTPSTTGSNEIISAGVSDIFLAKYNPSGAVQWLKRAGGADYEQGVGITTYGTDIYLTGYFYETANFNTPSASGSNEITSIGSSDVFIAKYNSSGNVQWLKRAGGTQPEIGKDIKVSGTDIYVVGRFTGTMNFNTPSSSGTNELTASTTFDIFLARYNLSGDYIAGKRMRGVFYNIPISFSLFNNNVYISSAFSVITNFNTPSASGSNELKTAGGSSTNAFLANYTFEPLISPTTTTLTSNNNPASVGGNIQFTATVTPSTATGTVTFKDGSTTLGTATLSSGIARFNTDLLTVGTHSITAEYDGDASNAASTSGAVSQVVNALTAPNLSFIRQSVGVSTNAVGSIWGTATDATGNLYVTGYFREGISLGNVSLTSAGDYDIFIAKYNSSGTIQWAKRAGGTGEDMGQAITVVGSDVYITGTFNETANFNTPSASGSNEITSAGREDIFIAKYNTSGDIQWIKRAGGSSIDFGTAITTLGTDIYITGSFSSTANFNTPSATGSNEITSAGAGNYDAFIAKYNASGILQWIKRAGGVSSDFGSDITASGTDIYLTGNFSFTANFNTPSATGSNELTSEGSTDVFIAKYNTSGVLQWLKRAGGSNEDRAEGITWSGTGLYVTGGFSSVANFNTPSASGSNQLTSAGSKDAFIARYNESGDLQWIKRAGGTGNDFGKRIGVSGSKLYVMGSFNYTINFNTPSTTGSNELTGVGINDLFLALFDTSGNYFESRRGGSTTTNSPQTISVFNDNVYIGGGFHTNANFNSPSATGSNELIAIGISEYYLAKYTFTSTPTTTTLTSNNNPASVGANIQFTATVTPNTATGTVTFKAGATTLGTATLSGGIARFNTDLLTVGTHSIIAEYAGNATNEGSTSGAVSQVVNALTAPNLGFIRQSASVVGATFGSVSATDASGNVYVTGIFQNSIKLGGIEINSAGNVDVFIAKYNSSGVIQWVRRAGGSGIDGIYGIAVSGSDLYVAGSFMDTANFNNPSVTGTNEVVSAGASDAFIAKYNTAGDLFWVKRAGGTGEDFAEDIVVSGTNVYVLGTFTNTVNFNTPSASGTNELIGAGNRDVFIAGYNSSGEVQWLKRAGSGAADKGEKIVVSGNDLYISGFFSLTANFNTPSATGSNEIVSAGGFDVFLAKYTTSGVFQWARRAGGTGDDTNPCLAISNSDVYLSGKFADIANFNTPSATGTNEVTSAGSTDVFLAKYNNSGDFQWARRAGGTTIEKADDIAVSGTNVYLLGNFDSNTINFNTPSASGSNEITKSGSTDAFFAKYNSAGNVLAVKRIGGTGTAQATDIHLMDNKVYLTGVFTDAMNFNNPSANGSNELVAPNDGFEMFLAEYEESQLSTTTTLTSNNNPANVGTDIQFTATVTPNTATGTVTFKDGTTNLGIGTLSGGIATFTTNTLTGGTHSITAEYSGDAENNGSISDILSQVVNCTAPTGTANATICSGTTASLSASCAAGTVSWYNSTSSTRLSTVSPFVTPPLTTATTYHVRCETVGCNSTFVSVNVTVNAAPNTVISYPSAAICKNASTTDIVRSGTTGGTFSSSPSGLSLNSSTGRITPGTSTAGSYTVTLTIAASGSCPAYTATTAITVTAIPSATIGYTSNGFCTTQDVQNVTRTGTAGGTYSAQPSGLTIDTNTGQITPGSSTPNNYVVYYNIPETGGCAAFQTNDNISIGTPANATIAYTGSPFCTTSSVKSVSRTGTAGGTFTSSPAGLTISSGNGQITPGTSTPNTYTVTYTIAASGGCPAFTTTTSVAVSAAPSATISYAANSFCTNESPKSVSRTGTSGGTYSVLPSGLTINASTGQITPGTSTPNDYTVYYTIPAANGCAEFQTSYNVSIRQAPDATISYTGSPFCSTSQAVDVNLTGTIGGTFTSSPVGLTINAGSGQITPGSSSQGNYTVTYTIAANGGCAAFTSTANVGISTVPNATIAYTGTPFCGATSPIEVSRTGTTGGTFTSSPVGLSINPTTGQITPGTSTMGTYTVTYSISGACPLYTTTASVSLNSLPGAPTNVATSTNSICGSESVSLSATCNNGTLTWYNQSTGGTALGTGTAFSQTPTTTTTYYAACKNGACESSRVATAPVVVQQANIGYDTPFSETGDNFPGYLVQNNLFGYKVRITKPIRVNAVSAIVSQYASGGARIRFAIYSDVNNVPTNLLASSSGNSSDNAPTLNAGLNSFPLDNPVTLNCGDYWIAYIVKAGVNNGEFFLLNQQLSDPTFYIPLNFASAFPATIDASSVSSNGNNIHNIYLTGVPDCGPDAPANISVSTTSACSGASIVLSATCSSGVVQWYNSQTGTAAIGTGSGLSVVLTNNTTYYASCKAGVLEGCRLPTSLVSVTPAPSLTAGSVTSPTVCGGTDGKIAFATALANGSYTITFTGSGSPKTINVLNGAFELTGLSAGTYSDFAITAVGCTSRDATSKSIADPSAPSAPIINAPSPRVVCSPNTLILTASGCAGTIRWLNGSSGTSLTLSSVGTYAISATCTVNNCVSNASSLVTGLEILALPSAPTITAPIQKVVCAPNTLTLTASGCDGTVNWSNGGSGTSITLSSVGTYSITATCSVGSCTSPASSAVTGLQIVAQPTVTITGNINLSCNTVSVTRTANGSGASPTYQWSNGLGTDATVNISSPGTYTVTVTGDNGCTATATTSVTVESSVPLSPIITAPNPKVVCAPSTLTLTASGCGGTVNWSNGGSGTSITLSSVGTYSITAACTVGSCTSVASQAVTGLQIVTQPSAPNITAPNSKVVCSPSILTLTASGCGGSINWSNGGSGTSITLSSVGTYSITATCTVGSCTSPASLAVTGLQIVTQPSAPTITAPDSKVVCAPSTLSLTASGCAGTVNWSNGGSGTSITLSSVGTYSITATCTVGSCTSPLSSAVTGLQIVTQPSAPTITAPIQKVVCAPSTLTLTASGCGGTVNWSNGGSGTSITLSSVGTYSITATCTVGSCTSPASSAVTGLQIIAPPTVAITGSINLSCNTASVTRTANGSGLSPTYQWSNSLGTDATATISSAGTYTVTVTGDNGCTATATTSVTVESSMPSAPTITAPTPKVVCTPSTLTLTASGCGGTVKWSNGGSGTSITLSSVGTYSITATCTVGSCTSPASLAVTGLQIVTQPSAPTITAPDSKVVCAPSTLSLTASGCGGTVNWSNGGSGTSITLSSVGTYSITATCTVGSCTSPASLAVTGLLIVTQPSAPTITAPIQKVVCAPSTLTLTASGCAGTVNWSIGGSGTSLTLSSVGTYSITATCSVGSCTSPISQAVTGLQIVTQPSAPTITAPIQKVVCAPNSLTLTASGCGGTVNWSNGGSGTSITLSSVGTYSITATCTVGSCTSPVSTAVTGLQIVTQPSAPTITSPNSKVICAPGTLTLTASGCGGTVNWSNGGSGTSITLSSVGTYSITATCTVGSCTSPISSAVTGLEIIATPIAQATNTGPYNIGQTIQLNASGGSSYNWSGPAAFSSSSQNPTIPNTLASNGGIYTVTVTNGACSATATTNVIVSGVDPCNQIVDLLYVKAGNPYEPKFLLRDGMIIQYTPEAVSIKATPICPNIPIGSVDLTIVGPNLNWTILQNVEPFTIFDNLGVHIYGRELPPGTYTFTVTGYPEDNRVGGTVYGPVVTTFTIVGTTAVINTPTIPNNLLCAGSTVDVNFTTTGTFDSNNRFNIQLSDSTGGFTNPTLIGTSTIAGTITCQLPQNISTTGRYLIRVVSSNQVVASNPTSQYLSVIPAAKNLTTNINTGIITEQASMQINADNKITSPANVTYNAGRAIILNPGFESREGSIFKAQIQGCNNRY